ncbi:MAG: hydantoinase/oxoprolinase family protein [Candidatus Abyssobacteria bacterium SURF_17]|uniref:Hydantoinase/oxoprolinase family protein n=1 Tax=Candidatus Abyssobacteria bacterium SURF_17 TaxID=2093361 RepID=A0A419EWE2_9BACT|nr:MAG: hydantoinase/oxoprolinase family protein [Candidatus Abyssubacteria bacterium SURF_17]
MSFRIGIDTGGTFTDVTLVDTRTGRYSRVKTPTTPEDLSTCFIEGIQRGIRAAGAEPELVDSIFHGTTFTTNLILEQRFSRLGLIVTDGFRHMLEIARQTVPGDLGDISTWIKPERPVPLENVEVVTERVNAAGEVLVDLDEEQVRQIAHRYRSKGIESISISLLHSYANSAHEIRIRDIFKKEYPECFVSISSEVLPEFREYERTTTTLINSFVVPYIWRYVEQIEARLREAGIRNHLYIMKSSGGSISAREAARKPIYTALSGPAAGVIGAARVCAVAGHENLITFDMGGTSTDICLVEKGLPRATTDGRISAYPIKIPMLNVVSIGAGGGSIAWVSPGKALRVGPQSAGAQPGPACYDKGGTDPTITDANLVLGRISSSLLGGEMKLNRSNAELAVSKLGDALGLSAVDAAAGILEIATLNMINGVRQVTTRKGRDPRDYTFVAFGGAGPLHAWKVAELLGIRKVIVPAMPGVLASLGLLFTDLREDHVCTFIQREQEIDLERLNELFTGLEREATESLLREGVPIDKILIQRSVDIRYAGQAYEVKVEAPAGPYSQREINVIVSRFHAEHENLFGYNYRDKQTIEIVNLRVGSVGLLDKPRLVQVESGNAEPPAPDCVRKVLFYADTGFVECPVFTRTRLKANNVISGPAVIEEYDSTTLINIGKKATVDKFGDLIII